MMMAILNFLPVVKRECLYGPLSGFPNYCLESVGAPDFANATQGHMSRVQDKGRMLIMVIAMIMIMAVVTTMMMVATQ